MRLYINCDFPMLTMTDNDFQLLSEFIQGKLGIRMPASKKVMLESRLQKRLRVLGIGSFSDYCGYLFSDAGIENELAYMIDIVTTHKTDFFREPDHFEFLVGEAVPELARHHGAGVRKALMIWSAGCSTGEEPYTLAIALKEFAARYPGIGYHFQILGTDVSVQVLEVAKRGVYREESTDPVSMPLRKKYVLRGKGKSEGLVRMAPELRSLLKFRQVNLVEEDIGFREYMDIIFCRNVLIYFDRRTQELVLSKLCRHLVIGGYLFVGHSESMSGFRLPLTRVAPAVYRKE